MQVSHIKTLTIADDPAHSEEVRPSDWNSIHSVALALSGNTLGASIVMGGAQGVIFNGGANVTLSGDTSNSQIIISANAGGGGGTTNQTGPNIAAGGSTVTSGTVVFSNSNGVSFSLNGQTMTASVKTDYVGLNSAVSNVTATINSSGISLDGRGYAGTNATMTGGSITLNTSGLSINLPAYLTTAMRSDASTAFAGTSAGMTGGSVTLNTSGIAISLPNYLTTARGSTDAVGLNSAQSNVTWTVNSSGISLDARGYAGTNTSFAGTNASASITLNSSGLSIALSAAAGGAGGGIAIADSASTVSDNTVVFSNSNGMQFGLNGSTMTAMQSPLSRYVPVEWFQAISATSTIASNTLFIFPLLPQANITFGQIDIMMSNSDVTTSAPNTITMSVANGSTMSFGYQAAATFSSLKDIYLFSRGAGVSTSNLMTFASTRVSFLSFATMTYNVSASDPAGNSTANFSIFSSYSHIVSVPGLSSGTLTSVNAASTATTWQTAYMPVTGSTTASTSNTGNTTATFSSSAVGAYPSTTMWTSFQMVPMPFATSLTAGEYWIGFALRSSSSATSGSTGGNLAAGNSLSFNINSGANILNTPAHLTTVGMTSSVVGSLGWAGSGVAATMAPNPGQGSFSATYTGNATYVNNMGQPNGAIAFSQINSNAAFWRPWMEFASIRI